MTSIIVRLWPGIAGTLLSFLVMSTASAQSDLGVKK
jgi:hypothetical protein